MKWLTYLGIFRLAGMLNALPIAAGFVPLGDYFMEPFSHDVVSFNSKIFDYQFPNTAYQELIYFRESEKQIQQARTDATIEEHTPTIPLVSISSTKESVKQQKEEFKILGKFFKQVQHTQVDTDHYVPLSNPEAIVDAIEVVL
eukprot:CAMPEP_0174275912 /NCGR_PEP_ID=MMETSP0439-20130205/60097_1 /TAXON_ID=0 /ORGANISM="Stereomyxa ramosa, Strain Chinc5" /LENGTH=142 /DNA_ID=CAMNT_0015368085 /DNA_START=679 /DNA_END=1107 /DNA_ORIENTATION=+